MNLPDKEYLSAKLPERLKPLDLILTDEIADASHFNRIIWMTLLGAMILGFALGFVVGLLLK